MKIYRSKIDVGDTVIARRLTGNGGYFRGVCIKLDYNEKCCEIELESQFKIDNNLNNYKVTCKQSTTRRSKSLLIERKIESSIGGDYSAMHINRPHFRYFPTRNLLPFWSLKR